MPQTLWQDTLSERPEVASLYHRAMLAGQSPSAGQQLLALHTELQMMPTDTSSRTKHRNQLKVKPSTDKSRSRLVERLRLLTFLVLSLTVSLFPVCSFHACVSGQASPLPGSSVKDAAEYTLCSLCSSEVTLPHRLGSCQLLRCMHYSLVWTAPDALQCIT